MKTSIAFAALLLAGAAASAQQQVWRCGNSYSQQPCPQGVAVKADDARTAAQAAESRANTARDAVTANAMEKERLAMEAKAATQPVAAAPAAAPASAPKAPPAKAHHAQKPGKKGKNFTALAPAAAPVALRPVTKAPAPKKPARKA